MIVDEKTGVRGTIEGAAIVRRSMIKITQEAFAPGAKSGRAIGR
jgi:hypothetical protein